MDEEGQSAKIQILFILTTKHINPKILMYITDRTWMANKYTGIERGINTHA